jgi:hypothetical protein
MKPVKALSKIEMFPSAYKRSFEDFCQGLAGDTESSSSNTSDEDSLDDAEEELEEDMIVKSMVAAHSTSDLARLVNMHTTKALNRKRQCVKSDGSPKRLPISASAPLLTHTALMGKQVEQPKTNFAFESAKPDDFLRSLMQQRNYTYNTVPALSLPDFFDQPTCSYDLELIQAVRDRDLQALRLKIEHGQSMNCSNKFGHTLLHTAARRGATEIVRFLLEESHDVTSKVVCDIGRTPLHDACWTAKPQFEIIKMLLDESPDLLFLTDKRGFTPMAYVPREHWGQWCLFLEERGADKLKPTEVTLL